MDKRGLLATIAERSFVAIDLGCGTSKDDADAIGVDSYDSPAVDVLGDALEVLTALPDASVDRISAHHFLEHVDDLEALLLQCGRVLRPGGRMEVTVPHFSNPMYYSDPSHVRFFGLYTFEYLTRTTTTFRRELPSYAMATAALETASVRLEFWSPSMGRNVVKRLATEVFNRSSWAQELYEETFCWLIPCYQLRFALRRVDT